MAKEPQKGGPSHPFLWTDDEVELLLNIVYKYKVKKAVESVDWDSCHCKYANIRNFPPSGMTVF